MRFSFRELHLSEQYQHNWHIDVMAHYLNLVSKGEVKKLIINMPPRMLKSECVSIAWPAWELGRDPRKKILCLHAHNALGRDLHDSCAELMSTRRYSSLFPSAMVKEGKGKLSTFFNGKRQFMPIGGRLTGLGADIIIIDDPISTEDARCPEMHTRLNRQFDENILQRLSDKVNGAIVVVMQRLHEGDLTGHLLAKNDGWVHLNLSAIALQDEVWDLPYGKTYHRPKGEPLHEERESLFQLQAILRSIGGYAFAYQYLQGQYKPAFGENGKGGLCLTPFREGEFWDARTSPHSPRGFHQFDESNLILPRVFGIGEDPYPENMRKSLTMEEWTIAAQEVKKQYLKKEEARLNP